MRVAVAAVAAALAYLRECSAQCSALASGQTCDEVLGNASCNAAAQAPQAGSINASDLDLSESCLTQSLETMGLNPSSVVDFCLYQLQTLSYFFGENGELALDEPHVQVVAISAVFVWYFIGPLLVFLVIVIMRMQLYKSLEEDEKSVGMDQKSMSSAGSESGVLTSPRSSFEEMENDVIPAYLSFHNLTYSVKMNKSGLAKAKAENGGKKPTSRGWDRFVILKGITGVFKPCTLTAIMGPSGCGKSTLLDILADRKHGGRVTGKVLVNGRERSALFKRISGYVMQFDSLFPYLTVREILQYTAELRIPGEDLKSKRTAVKHVIKDLDLRRVADTRVGGNGVPGISGGQARRVTVGIELVTRPAILFLDEPTTGLDSFSSLQLVRTLRVLADSGRTVVATIHQPRPDIFELFDSLLLMKSGEIAYFGSVMGINEYFARLNISIPTGASVADFVVDLTYSGTKADNDNEEEGGVKIAAEFPKSYKTSQPRQEVNALARSLEDKTLPDLPPHASSRFLETDPQTGELVPDVKGVKFSQSVFRQMFILLRRSYKNQFRDKTYFLNVMIQMVQFLFFGLLWLGLRTQNVTDPDAGRNLGILDLNVLFILQQRGFLFQVLNTVMLIEVVVIANAFVEKKIFRREHASGAYSVVAYHGQFIVRFYVDAVWKATLAVVLSYFFPPMRVDADAVLFFIAVLMVASTFGSALAFLMVSLIPDAQGASTAHSQILGTFGLYSGFFLFPNIIPIFMLWLYYLLPLKYAFEALEWNEFTCMTVGERDDLFAVDPTLNRWTNLLVFMVWPPVLHVAAIFASFLHTRSKSYWEKNCPCCCGYRVEVSTEDSGEITDDELPVEPEEFLNQETGKSGEVSIELAPLPPQNMNETQNQDSAPISGNEHSEGDKSLALT